MFSLASKPLVICFLDSFEFYPLGAINCHLKRYDKTSAKGRTIIYCLRKFCPTVIGCYYWNDLLYLYVTRNLATRKRFKKALFHYYFAQY